MYFGPSTLTDLCLFFPLCLSIHRRYAGKKPDPQLQGDLQAWRIALNNLRAQHEHQGNK